MALSQLQCLDDNHVNPRTNESKPEFLYCEDQRLALEALLRGGREAFFKYLEARGLRGFLSDPELETLGEAVEPFDPGSELFPENAADGDPPLSLSYWPELSDTTVPRMDLGWPHSEAYRGVTRTTIYSQPPLDGQTHIKETVRKMIAQAQKVIAVVMDVFTDVDIFRDLLDAGFKRRVSVYILLERTTLPHFLAMCQRANMHAGHLKHLRVRCSEGVQFHTRSSTKVRGRMGHRFMFIDGDKAVSGSYSFTWMSSRLDRNLITVITGQAVEAFDRLFRVLYMTSSFVELRQVAMEPEPVQDPLPQPAAVTLPSVTVARKLYNPKYALALGDSNSTPSADHNSPKNTSSQENSKNPEVHDPQKRRRRRTSKESLQEAHPIHPGLTDLEKACLISYLPTWPEPDPPSDVIGFINVRDSSKPPQVHLQRSEMFEMSQAIRFSSPFSMPEETLPEVAKPRQLSAGHELNKPAQDKTKADESVMDRAQPTQLSAWPGDIKSKVKASEMKSPASGLNTEDKLHANAPISQHTGHSVTPHLNEHTPAQSNSNASTPNIPYHATQAVPTNNPTPECLTGPNTEKGETGSNTQSVYRAHSLKSNSTETSPTTSGTMDSNTGQSKQRLLSHTESHVQAVQPQDLTSLPGNVSITAGSNNNKTSPTSSSTTLCPPVPKPRTLQLVIQDRVTNDIQKLQEFSVMERHNTGSQVVHAEPAVATDTQKKSPEKESEILPELQNNSQSKTEVPKDTLNIGKIEEALQQSGTFQEIKYEETVGLHNDRAGLKLVAGTNVGSKSDVVITDKRAEGVTIPEKNSNYVDPKTLTLIDCKLTPQTDFVATESLAGSKPTKRVQTGHKFTQVPHENRENSYSARDTGVLDAVHSLKASTHIHFSAVHKHHTSKDIAGDCTNRNTSATHSQEGFAAARCTDILPNTARHNTHSIFQDLIPKARVSTHTPEKSLCIHLSDTHTKDWRSPMPERESRSLAPLLRTPTSDGFLPDSRIHTPDPRSYTPDFRTPTSDISDGYVSPRTDSTFSTTSEEYYECSDSPFHDAVFEQAAYCNQGTKEDRARFTHTIIATSPECINYNTKTDRNTSSSETQSLSGPSSISSSSSFLDKNIIKGGEEKNAENGEAVNEMGLKLSVADGRTGVDFRKTARRGSEEAKSTADHFKQGKGLTHTDNVTEAEPQVPKRKRLLSQSPVERLVDRGVTPGELTNKRAEPNRLSAGNLKPKNSSSEGERPDKGKGVDVAALGPSSLERRGRPQSTRETEGQKLSHTPHRPQPGLQQERGVCSPFLQSRSSRPLSGAHPSGSRQLSQAESKALHGSVQVLNNTSTPRRPPTRPPSPGAEGADGSAAGQKQAEVSHGLHNLLSQQPTAAQGRSKARYSLNLRPDSKPQASFLHAHSDVLQHHLPFSVTFSRMYSLKDLKDKISKLPTKSKRGSASSAAQLRKSTS